MLAVPHLAKKLQGFFGRSAAERALDTVFRKGTARRPRFLGALAVDVGMTAAHQSFRHLK